MNKEARLININEWEKFGGGYTADSYFHKTDDTVMLKLFTDFLPPSAPLNELEQAERVRNLGIPTAKPIEYVTDGKRYGAIFQRIKDKKSLARLMADEPERTHEVADIFYQMVNQLHSTPCDITKFRNISNYYADEVKKCAKISEKQRQGMLNLIYRTPDKMSCIHGDLQAGNIIIAGGVSMFIDIGDFSYGNPLYDLSVTYYTAYFCPREMCYDLYHVYPEQMQDFWSWFARQYFKGMPLADVNKLVGPYSAVMAAHFVNKAGLTPDLEETINTFFPK